MADPAAPTSYPGASTRRAFPANGRQGVERTRPEHGLAVLSRTRAELAAELEQLERRARQLRADILHLDAAMAIVDPSRCSADAPRRRVQHRPEWFADLGRLCLDVLRGAAEPLTSRQVAVAVMGLAGHDAEDDVAVQIVEHRVHASLTRRVGIVERVALGTHRKGWRVAAT
jgi:hypothetical protein